MKALVGVKISTLFEVMVECFTRKDAIYLLPRTIPIDHIVQSSLAIQNYTAGEVDENWPTLSTSYKL